MINSDIYPHIKIIFLAYHRTIKAIPRSWKDILQLNEPNFVKITHQKTKPAKFAFVSLRRKLPSTLDSLFTIWSIDLNEKLSVKEISTYFKRIIQITLCTKLRYFQYRIVSKALSTNVIVPFVCIL